MEDAPRVSDETETVFNLGWAKGDQNHCQGPLSVSARQPIPESLGRISPELRLGNQISIPWNTHADV